MNALDPADLLIEVINLRMRCGDMSYTIKSQAAQIEQLETQIRWMGGRTQWTGNHDTTTRSAELPRTKTTNESGADSEPNTRPSVPTIFATETRMNWLNHKQKPVID